MYLKKSLNERLFSKRVMDWMGRNESQGEGQYPRI